MKRANQPGHIRPFLSRRDIARVAFRFKWRAMFVFTATILGALVYIALVPRQYVSQAQILVNVGRESVGLDPTATTGHVIDVNESRASEINSVLEMFGSRNIIESVVDELGPLAILDPAEESKENEPVESNMLSGIEGQLDNATSQVRSWMQQVHLSDPLGDHEMAVMELGDTLSHWTPKDSNIIVVECRSHTPAQAQTILENVIACYQEVHLRAYRTKGSYEFFEEQSESIHQQLDEAERTLQKAKNEFGLISIGGKRESLQGQINAVETAIRENESNLSASEAKITSLTESLGTIPEQLVTQEVSGMTNDAADGMRQQLFELEVREQEMLANYSAVHPLLISLQAEIKEARRIYNEEMGPRVETTTGLNPTHQPLRLEMLTEQSVAESLNARGLALSSQYASLQTELRQVNEQEVTIAELQRNVDLLDSNYNQYAKSLEQSRIDHALELEKISNVNVVQVPTLSELPTRPKKALTMGLALIAAICGAIASVVVSHQSDPSFRSIDEVERELDVPVLISVPLARRQGIVVH